MQLQCIGYSVLLSLYAKLDSPFIDVLELDSSVDAPPAGPPAARLSLGTVSTPPASPGTIPKPAWWSRTLPWPFDIGEFHLCRLAVVLG